MNKYNLIKSREDYINILKKDPEYLKYIPDQTEELCLVAVNESGFALRYVKDKTYEICLAAVKKNGYALKYIDDQTEELCLEAVKNNGYSLQFVKNQTDEICLEAILNDEQALFNELRETMKKFDEEVTSLSQSSSCAGGGMQVLPEGMVQQNNCSQICQLPSLEEEAQTPETACQLQSE